MADKKKADDGQQPEAVPARKLDESIREGGLYIKNGRVVDAVGAVLSDWTVDSDGNPTQIAAASDTAGK